VIRFFSESLPKVFQEPPFWFGGPFMIFMGLLGRASRQTGNNLIPIGEGIAHNGQRLPVYDWSEYIAEKDRLLETSESTRASFEGFVRNGDFQFYVNEMLARGASIRIDATAVTRIDGKALHSHDFPESPEMVKAFFVSAGFSDGEGVTFAIATPERKVVREIFKAFFEKYQELGSPKAALQWLLESAWSHLIQI
jgi:hypothetical protein